MSGKAILYTGVDWGRFLDLERPVENRDGRGRSSHSKSPGMLIQVGLIEETKMTIQNWSKTRIVLQTNADHADFFEELREQIILTIQRNSRSWFRKDLYRRNIEKMLKPFTRRSRVSLRLSPEVRVWCFDGDGEARRGSLDTDLQKHARCCVTLSLKGLWFEERQFGPVLDVKDLLIFPNEQEEDSSDSECSDVEEEVRRRFHCSSPQAREDLINESDSESADAPLDDEGASFATKMPFGKARDQDLVGEEDDFGQLMGGSAAV